MVGGAIKRALLDFNEGIKTFEKKHWQFRQFRPICMPLFATSTTGKPGPMLEIRQSTQDKVYELVFLWSSNNCCSCKLNSGSYPGDSKFADPEHSAKKPPSKLCPCLMLLGKKQ